MTRTVVWHRDDLRVEDNAALATAAREGTPVPVFVVDPAYFDDRGLACDARLAFLLESLADLDERYRERGSSLVLLFGDPEERLPALLETLDARAFVNRSVTARRARERDERFFSRQDVRVFADDGICWDGRPDDWSDRCEAHFEADPHDPPGDLSAPPLESDVTVEAVRERFTIAPGKRDVPRGGATAAQRRLDAFCRSIRDYPGNIAPPAAAERGTSRLSASLKFGCLSVRQVYQATEDAPRCRGREAFRTRLYWNRHYAQKLADWPGYTERSVNPVFRGLHAGDRDPDRITAWKEGRTGFPMVDAAMRALVETGFINFRMRALCASFFAYVLKQWWKEGADFMYYHLLDADPAVNYPQWQMQAGLVGVHPVRVYNPAKQAREYDSDGEYIRRYVPELAALPDEHLPQPDGAPLATLEAAGVDLGTDYPYPIVEYDHEAREARELFAGLADRAREALSIPEVRRHASLSRRQGDPVQDEGSGVGGDGQSTLGDF